MLNSISNGSSFCSDPRSLKMGRNFIFGCVIVFFLFSTQSQVQQIIIGMVRMIHHIRALSVVVQMALKQNNFKKLSQGRENWFEIFEV